MRKNRRPPPRIQQPQFWRNHSITAPELRVIGPTGEQLGVLSKYDALKIALEANLDLVEVAPRAKPPVAKIIDYNKFIYETNKKRREKGPIKSGDIKEVWLKPFMADHDLQSKIKRGKELLKERGKLKVVVRFKRREVSRMQFGYAIFNKFVEGLGEVRIEREPKMFGPQLIAIISRK